MYFKKEIVFLREAISQDFNVLEKFYYVMYKPGGEWVVSVTCFIVPEVSCDCITLFILWLYYSLCNILKWCKYFKTWHYLFKTHQLHNSPLGRYVNDYTVLREYKV